MAQAVMTIGGKREHATTTFGVINPATGVVFAEAPDCSQSALDDAVDAADRAFRSWRLNEDARREGLRRAAQAVSAAQAELAALITAEQCKPLAAAAYEVEMAALWLTNASTLVLPREVLQDDAMAYAEVTRRPLGVVAAITPWNYPLLLAAWKIGPALLAGNTLVLKPSPFTPLSSLLLGEILAAHLPPGVVNVVSGGDDVGVWLTHHPAVRKISFTGSVATGKAIASAAAPDLKRITLELGGNDAAIVLDDADPATIARDLFWGAFINCGQICAGVKRVYAPESLYDEVVAALAERARKVRVGPGTQPNVQMGPINNRPQFERVTELVDDALAQGATAVAGGKPMGGAGYFYAPTILTNVRDGMRIVDEEQFGPALPILPYRELDDAVARANATHFGLCGSVWSSNVARATEVCAQLECGTTYINAHLAIVPHLPFGGVKWSGIGVENGQWGLDEYTSLRTLYRAKG